MLCDVDLGRRGLNILNAADRALTSLNFSTTNSVDVPKSTESDTGASKRECLFFLPNVGQFNPQMSLNGHHPAPDSGSWLFGGLESKVCGTAQLSDHLRGKTLAVIQVFQQV